MSGISPAQLSRPRAHARTHHHASGRRYAVPRGPRRTRYGRGAPARPRSCVVRGCLRMCVSVRVRACAFARSCVCACSRCLCVCVHMRARVCLVVYARERLPVHALAVVCVCRCVCASTLVSACTNARTPRQTARFRERRVAHVALVRPLPCVRPHVLRQRSRLRERHVAHVALVRPLRRVHDCTVAPPCASACAPTESLIP
jgi:hypothetical protein